MPGHNMRAEIIAVGSELLTPDHCDTNSLLITERLNQAGFAVHLKSVVGDRSDDIAALVRAALRRSDFVVICGGLGPTEDDLTRRAVAGALGRQLSVNAPLLEQLRVLFARRGYPMRPINERQAEVIEGAEVLENAVGTAPGLWLQEGGVQIVLLPGPPRELSPMMENHVLPRALKLGAGRHLVKQSFRVLGMTESEVDSRIAPIYTQYPQVDTTILASRGYIGIRLHQWAGAWEQTGAIEDLACRIERALGSAIFTRTDDSLEEVVGRLLRQSGRTLAVAESCTAGMIGCAITRIPGSSDYFLGGILCYSDDIKERLCGVPGNLLCKHGAVSAEVAEALAEGVRLATGSSTGLSVTGIAGPGGGSPEKPVGLVYVGLADGSRVVNRRRVLPGDRALIRERASYAALAFLYQHIIAARNAGQP
jgi:nicotinamide-nucleotide amidase